MPQVAATENEAHVGEGAGNTGSATIFARDFGAYGVLRVTAIMEGGSSELPGHLRGRPDRTEILLPHSRDDSIMPLQWKQAHRVAHLTDDRDNEDIPSHNPGDGLSLYEEYRGLVVRGKHVRTDPLRKTLFVHTKVPHADGGLRLLQSASGLQVLRINEADYHGNTIRVVNSNHGAEHIVDQHGVWIVSKRIDAHAGGQSPLGPPRYVDRVDMQYNNAGWGAEYRDTTIAHELCHALAVRHHGDDAYWRVVSPGELPVYALGGDLFVAVQGGQHSGNDSCMVRYNWGDLIERVPGDAGSLVEYGQAEPDGTRLCLSTAGTGVNAPGHKPHPKCGDATRGRGSCWDRITVSDIYPRGGGND